MSNPTYFVQGCPTCGRRLQVRVEYLGKAVVCQHCRGKFVARDASLADPAAAHSPDDLVRRANELLQYATRQVNEPGAEIY